MKKVIYLLVFVSLHVSAQFVTGDKNYFKLRYQGLTYIYPEEYRKLIPMITSYNKSIHHFYEKSFRWRLDEEEQLVLASSYNQIANAFATVIPYTMNVNYGAGGTYLEQTATTSWLFTLLAHEGAHLYQLNPKRGISKAAHKVLGNSIYPNLFVIIPIFTNPNAFAPSWLLEGNSVLNESIWGNGGRLYSGESRALFYTLLKANKITPEFLINHTLSFPYGREKYIVGGYFFHFLAKRYGIDHANQYFYEQANRYFIPWMVDTTFRHHFGVSYYSLLYEFLWESKKEAENQKEAQGEVIARSQFHSSFSETDAEIHFLTHDLKETPVVHKISKETGTHSSYKKNLTRGPIFEDNGKLYTSASGLVGVNRVYYSLWDDKDQDLKEFRSKIVLDKRGDDILWLDAKDSFHVPKLYHNQTFIAETSSSAVFDKERNIYYFVQEGETKTLYKNDTKLFEYQSYYGKPVDVVDDRIYFIAATEYGSTLFSYQEGEIRKELPYDTIIDAKRIDTGAFITAEITANGYLYRITDPEETTNENPSHYDYFFKEEDSFKFFNKNPLNDEIQAKESSYHALTNLKYSGTSLQMSFVGSATVYNLAANFIDPLFQNTIQAQVQSDPYIGKDEYRLTYFNQKYRLNWLLSYNQENYYAGKDTYAFRRKRIDRSATVGFLFPIMNFRRWHLMITQLLTRYTDDEVDESYTSLDLSRTVTYPLNFGNQSHFAIQTEAQTFSDNEATYTAYSQFEKSFSKEYSLKLDGLVKYSNRLEIELHEPISPSNAPIYSTKRVELYFGKKKVTGGRAGVSIGKAFAAPLYFKKFPLSLRQMKVEAIYNHFYYQGLDMSEYGPAVTAELLAFHVAPLRITYYQFKKRNNETVTSVILGAKTDF